MNTNRDEDIAIERQRPGRSLQLFSRRHFLKSSLAGASLVCAPGFLSDAAAGLERAAGPKSQYKVDPVLRRAPDLQLEVRRTVGAYLAAVTEQWLKVAPLSNPSMLDMFRDRDRQPYRDLVPW